MYYSDRKKEKSIIFIPDNRPVDNKEQIDNIRLNISSRAIVDFWISLCEEIGDVYRYHTSRIDDFHINISPLIKDDLIELETYRDLVLGLIKKNNKHDPNCFCKKLKPSKFSKCHLSVIKTLILKMKNITRNDGKVSQL